MFFIRIPDGFCPEDHGWQPQHNPIDVNPAQPGHEGFGVWVRVRPGLEEHGRESLVICDFDEPTGAYGAWFYPIPLPEERPALGVLWERLKDNPN